MKKLLKVQDKLSGTRKIRQCRILTKDDFVIRETIHLPAHCREDPEQRPLKFVESIHAKYVLQMKQEVIDHMLDVMNVQMGTGRDGKPLFPRREMLDPFCLSWNPDPAWVYAGIDRSIDYRGISAKNVGGREKKYQKIRKEVMDEWSRSKDQFLDFKILQLDEHIPTIIEECNQRFEEALESLIVKLNVKEEWFLKYETDSLSLLRMRIEELDEEIKEKRELRKQAEAAYYSGRRQLLVDHIVKDGDFSKETTEEVKRLASEAPDIPESKRRVFGY